jgi:hypothetical protein
LTLLGRSDIIVLETWDYSLVPRTFFLFNMWLFTPKGFISVVADKSNVKGDGLLVRARNKSHLDGIREYLSCDPFEVQVSDYAWRAWTTRLNISMFVMSHIASMDYTNFKNEIHDYEYHDACLGVWEEMWKYQHKL